MDDIDHEKISTTIAWYWVLGVILVTGTTFFTVMLKPQWLGFEREAYVESHQYVESQKSQLLTNIEKHDELEAEISKYEKIGEDKIIPNLRMQQDSLKKKIRASLEKIPEDQQPSNVDRFKR